MSDLSTVAPESAIARVVADNALPVAQTHLIIRTFDPLYEESVRLLADARAVPKITDPSQVTDIKSARLARLQLRAHRIETEKARKTLKDQALVLGRKIDEAARLVMDPLSQMETELEAGEKLAERIEAERIATKTKARQEALRPFVADVTIYPLGMMSEEAWAQLLDGSRAAFEAKRAADIKAEQERIAAEQARRVEEERIRAENARLVREAEEREAKARAEREAAEAEQRARDSAARAERERLQAEADAKLRAERELRELAEANARRIREDQEARERAERERAEAERLAREEAEAAAAAAPDAQKLEAFVDALLAVPAPEMATEPGRAALSLVLMARLNMCIEAKAIAARGLVKRRRAK